MKISAKGRYALAAVIEIAKQRESEDIVSVVNISNTLGISKIYLEQILSQLKNGKIIYSVKGSKGGYKLARESEKITAFEVLLTVESNFIETAGETVAENAPDIEAALRELVFNKLDDAIESCLGKITIDELVSYSEQQRVEQSFMLYM